MRALAAAVTVVLLLAAADAGDDPATKTPPLELVQTIPLPKVEGRLDHFALDAKRKRLYLAALGNGSLEIVSLEKGERLRQITGLPEPQGVAFAPDLDRLVVACGGDGSVRFYSGETAEPGAKLDLGGDADNARYDPVTQRFFVGAGDGSVASVHGKKPAVLASAELGAHPESLQLETTGRRLFVNVEHAAEVAVVDRFEMTVTARWKLGGAKRNFPMALDEAGKRLFVGCRAPASIVTLSTDDGKVLANTDCSEDPDDVFVDTGRKRIYVSCGAGFVDVFSRGEKDELKRVAKVETRKGARTAYFDAAGDRLYVAVPKDGDKDAEIRVFAPR